MKNILKFKIAFLAILSSLLFSSCLVDDDVKDFGKGPNLVGFSSGAVNLPVNATGEEFDKAITISIIGPTVNKMEDDVNISLSLADSSTAVAGTNYEFTSDISNVVLTAENDYTTTLPLRIKTEGIVPPVTKTLELSIDEVTTSENVLANEKSTNSTVSIIYNCPTDLTGTYTMTNDVCSPTVEGITIEADGNGGWALSVADGGLLASCTSNTGLVNNGTISVVCGEVTEGSTAFCGSNGIGCITGGTWNPDTGVLVLQLNDTFFGVGDYTGTYTRN